MVHIVDVSRFLKKWRNDRIGSLLICLIPFYTHLTLQRDFINFFLPCFENIMQINWLFREESIMQCVCVQTRVKIVPIFTLYRRYQFFFPKKKFIKYVQFYNFVMNIICLLNLIKIIRYPQIFLVILRIFRTLRISRYRSTKSCIYLHTQCHVAECYSFMGILQLYCHLRMHFSKTTKY